MPTAIRSPVSHRRRFGIRVRGLIDGARRRMQRLRSGGHLRSIPGAVTSRARRPRQRRWPQPRRRRLAHVLLWIIGPLLLAIVVVSVVTVLVTLIRGDAWGVTMGDISERCDATGFACDVSTSLVFTLAPLLLASLVFLVWRLTGIRRPLVDAAKKRPAEYVETAGNIVGEVIGRDDLCQVLEDDLRDAERRRPHVLVGSVGAGKTAVLVQLTAQLAERGAVPVPLRLRDADDARFDFLSLARDRFMRETQRSVWPEAERERVWQRLLQNDQIVVLADGLEEVLAESAENKDRDHSIRAAVAAARKQGYPLVIASRPHNALVELDAALVHLEPVSEEAALAYIEHDRPGNDQQRLVHLVERAEVVETPLYVQIARELRDADLLHPKLGMSSRVLDTRNADRVKLRMALLKTWLDGLVEGELESAMNGSVDRVALTHNERQATIYQLSALACAGLANDTMEVGFDMLLEPVKQTHVTEKPRFPELSEAVSARIADLSRKRRLDATNVRVATTMGVRLGLVEHRRNGVRFRHSLLQAYLGSLLMADALRNAAYVKLALEDPGREFLIALVMFAAGEAAGQAGPNPPQTWRAWLTGKLMAAAEAQPPWPKPLELLSAACEIDSVDRSSNHRAAPTALVKQWNNRARDAATMDVKLRAVARLGESGLRFAGSKPGEANGHGMYRHLFRLCGDEDMYPIRVASAQQIGAGGDVAFAELRKLLAPRTGGPPHAASTAAWLVPMLYGSADKCRDAALERLLEWMSPPEPLPLSIEAALAQGFKFAANRRPGNPHESAESRATLAQLAHTMLDKSRFWYSRMTLLHALCLWELAASHEPTANGQRRNHDGVVGRWLQKDADGNVQEHRFVHEAATLAVQALRSRQPERYMWIDESGVVTKVGSQCRDAEPHAMRNLWIAPSAGWLALHPRAQQLVADVLIALNLAERGGADGAEARLEKLNAGMPSCLTDHRCDHLMLSSAVGVSNILPGETCQDGCPVRLCPYPPKGQQPFRVELSEAFCRSQVAILGRRRLHRAPWQNAPKSELKRFWSEMERRARV